MELYYLPVSPWSERMLFGLQVAGVKVALVEYTPFVSEPYLRWKMGRFNWNEQVTVPVLLLGNGQGYVEGSLPILKHLTNGKLLWPKDQDKLARITALVDVVLKNGRYRYSVKTSQTGGRLDVDMLSFPLNKVLPWLPQAVETFLVKTFASKFLVKYDADRASDAFQDAFDEMHKALTELEDMIQDKPYVCDNTLTVADIILSSAMPFVALPGEFNNIGPQMLAQMQDPELENAFPRLVKWRNELYAQHRRLH
ncbi:hypothetical protein BASA81_007079 [Batrachochytrium salamandrivorans]|nr:hypothetical protein BASA81_007079 [Batrachochytrium salamandrivorans]